MYRLPQVKIILRQLFTRPFPFSSERGGQNQSDLFPIFLPRRRTMPYVCFPMPFRHSPPTSSGIPLSLSLSTRTHCRWRGKAAAHIDMLYAFPPVSESQHARSEIGGFIVDSCLVKFHFHARRSLLSAPTPTDCIHSRRGRPTRLSCSLSKTSSSSREG